MIRQQKIIYFGLIALGLIYATSTILTTPPTISELTLKPHGN